MAGCVASQGQATREAREKRKGNAGPTSPTPVRPEGRNERRQLLLQDGGALPQSARAGGLLHPSTSSLSAPSQGAAGLPELEASGTQQRAEPKALPSWGLHSPERRARSR